MNLLASRSNEVKESGLEFFSRLARLAETLKHLCIVFGTYTERFYVTSTVHTEVHQKTLH